jgi:hypothetical protein
VNWDTDFTIKIWKCLVANLNFALKYDIEEVDKVQWRQMLNLGIGYSLPRDCRFHKSKPFSGKCLRSRCEIALDNTADCL